MVLAGWDVARLARHLSRGKPRRHAERRQTIQHLIRDDRVKRCEYDRLRWLAHALDVPEAWLAGDDYGVPIPGYAPLMAEAKASPRVMLAVSRLLSRCYDACLRDFGAEFLTDADKPRPPAPRLGPSPRSEDVMWFILSAIGHVLSPRIWRFRLTTSESHAVDGRPEDADGPAWPLTLSPEHEDAVVGLVRAFEYVLEPWLGGHAELDMKRVRALAAVLNPSVDVILPDSWDDPRSRIPDPPEAALDMITQRQPVALEGRGDAQKTDDSHRTPHEG